MFIAVLFSMCITANAATNRAYFEGQYDNLADWPELRIYADNLTFTQKNVQTYLESNTLEEEIAKAARSVVVLDNGLAYEKGFALIDASNVRASSNAFGYEVRLYLTADTTKEYIPITLYVTGSEIQPPQVVPPISGVTQPPVQTEQPPAVSAETPDTAAPNQEPLPDDAPENTPDAEPTTEPEQPAQTAPLPDSDNTENESEDTGMDSQEKTAALSLPDILNYTCAGSFVISGLVWIAALPEIVSGFHVLAWYEKKKKENAGHSHPRAI